MTIPIPDYSAPFKPLPNVTPFTLRDGDTMLKKIDYINKYIARSLIPWIDENYALLGDQFEEQVNLLIAQVNEAIQSVIDDSITVQDPVVAALVNNAASLTRIALDNVFYTKAAADAKFRTILLSYSKTEVDSAFRTIATSYSKTEVDGLIDGRASDAELTTEANNRISGDNALDTRLDVLEPLILTGGGRLTEAYLDARYVNELAAGHMVTLGSSNAVPATLWANGVATDLGLTNHSFALTGGSFTGAGAGRFENQLAAAIADTSFPKANVRIVLLGDASNDMRAQADVADEAENLFYTARLNYPNARIVVVPAVWNLYADNVIPGRQVSVLRRYYEMTVPAAKYDVELINYSWTWHFDSPAWIDTVHLTTAGYEFLRGQVTKYIRHGGDMDRPLGYKLGVAQSAVPADYMYLYTSRSGNIGTIASTFMANDLGVDTPIAIMQPGANPAQEIIFECYQTTNRNATGTLILYPDGLLRTWGALDGGTSAEIWTVHHSYNCF